MVLCLFEMQVEVSLCSSDVSGQSQQQAEMKICGNVHVRTDSPKHQPIVSEARWKVVDMSRRTLQGSPAR